jgi:REP element-mobilizing transposase RayT
MPRLRKTHQQQCFEFRTHGGKRAGAGRPPKGKRSSEPHKTRPKIDARHPLHITTRVVDGLSSLRKKDIFLAIREATIAVFEREGFHLVHASIQYNHLHVLAEATSSDKLSRGIQAFLISAAKRINVALSRRTGTRRRGKVFADRYDARALTSPRAVRHTLAYVLNNWRRHGEDRAPFTASWKVDPFSSGIAFPGWTELADSPVFYMPPPTYMGLLTWFPRTWLLRVGWMKHGPISVREVPGRA